MSDLFGYQPVLTGAVTVRLISSKSGRPFSSRISYYMDRQDVPEKTSWLPRNYLPHPAFDIDRAFCD